MSPLIIVPDYIAQARLMKFLALYTAPSGREYVSINQHT